MQGRLRLSTPPYMLRLRLCESLDSTPHSSESEVHKSEGLEVRYVGTRRGSGLQMTRRAPAHHDAQLRPGPAHLLPVLVRVYE
jgi:hypothetical protein